MALDPSINRSSVTFELNGQTVSAENVPPQTTLLDYLRARGLTGTKDGCAEGECGACTVVMLKGDGSGSAYQPVNSCLMYLPMAAGHEIYTVEALAAEGNLNAVQRSIAGLGGSQCGYCTPGFVMSLFAEFYRPGRSSPCDPHALNGNLCRCTGYRPIRDAVLSLGAAPDDHFARRLSQPAPALAEFYYKDSEAKFSRPATLADCVSLLHEYPDARVVAGATDLAIESNLRGRHFPHLISVEALPELRRFRETDSHVEIGTGLTLAEIGANWHDAPPVFREWLPLFASPLIRNRATLGGNLATASPIGDAAPLLLALDAQVQIANQQGFRMEPLRSYFLGYRQTVLQPAELLVSIHLPKPFPTLARFYKAAKRRMDDISTVAACFAITLGDDGRVQSARCAFGGVSTVPKRAIEAEEAILGKMWNGSATRSAQDILARTMRPISDHRGSADYRVALTQSLLRKFEFETRGAAA